MHYLVLRNSVPVEERELEADLAEALGAVRYLEHDRLVEDGIEGALLHVRLSLGDALIVVEQVDLDVGVRQARHVHLRQIARLQHDDGQFAGRRLPAEGHQKLASALGLDLS